MLRALASHATACHVKAPARLRRLSALELNGDVLPTEFRIFAAGVNETSKGPSLFDAEAAAAVMADYEKRGVDLMIDLNHDSLDEEVRKHRSDADDARGWFKLELRNGELWATSVTWTDDGAARLREKRQRYVSPAFYQDEKTGRVTEIVNVAICAMPATHNAAPLVAASARTDERRTASAKARAAGYVALVKAHATAAIARSRRVKG